MKSMTNQNAAPCHTARIINLFAKDDGEGQKEVA